MSAKIYHCGVATIDKSRETSTESTQKVQTSAKETALIPSNNSILEFFLICVRYIYVMPLSIFDVII